MNKKMKCLGAGAIAVLFSFSALSYAQGTSTPAPCNEKFSEQCNRSFEPSGAKKLMHYYASLDAKKATVKPTSALIAIHGFKHTVQKTFDGTLLATKKADKLNEVLVVTPIFHADAKDPDYQRCMAKDAPVGDQSNDLLWSCQGWMEGAMATNDSSFSSFDALDALINELKEQWPSLKTITIAGFSAGGQVVQRYVANARARSDIKIKYIISDPGSWFYFDDKRPVLVKEGKPIDWDTCLKNNMQNCSFVMTKPDQSQCPNYNHWKYGVVGLPTYFKRTPEQMKAAYAQADIHYLQGAEDASNAPGTVYNLLDKSCSANLQGPFRMQRGLAFAAYDRAMIAPNKNRQVTVVPACKHNVTCVFSSDLARPILFGN